MEKIISALIVIGIIVGTSLINIYCFFLQKLKYEKRKEKDKNV